MTGTIDSVSGLRNEVYSRIMLSFPTKTDKNDRMLTGPYFNFKGIVSQNIKSMNTEVIPRITC